MYCSDEPKVQSDCLISRGDAILTLTWFDFRLLFPLSSKHSILTISKSGFGQPNPFPMSFTPRRSTRGQIFTPSPHPTTTVVPRNITFRWTSQPLEPSLSIPESVDNETNKVYYNSFARFTQTQVKKREEDLLTPLKKKKQGEEARFSIGDGVLVRVEGGVDGIGILIRLWEEAIPEEEIESEAEGGEGGKDKEEENGQVEGRRMMGEVHWCFRRKDLPGIMKNLSVKDVSGFVAVVLQRSVVRRVAIRIGSARCARSGDTSNTKYASTPCLDSKRSAATATAASDEEPCEHVLTKE